MIRVRRSSLNLFTGLLAACLLGAAAIRAQSTAVPAVTSAVPVQTLAAGGNAATVDLRNYFGVTGVTDTVVQFTTDLGRFNVQMLSTDAPISVANFLSYVADRTYDSTIIHRSITFASSGFGIIQGGGYAYAIPISVVAKKSPIVLEYKVLNSAGTLAMARTSDANSATSEWFFNTVDNSSTFGPANGGGYAVFGRVLGTGTTVTTAINALPPYNLGSPLTDTPLQNVAAGQTTVNLANFVRVSSIAVVPVYPAASGASVLTFSVTTSDATVATGAVSGSSLTITAVAGGTATLTVRATDTNGNFITTSVAVVVNGALAAPAFVLQPVAQTVASGSTVVFNASATGSPSFRWQRNGTDVPGATSATFVISGATTANAGSYTVVASNPTGTVTSTAATLAVSAATATELSRLVNLSILTTAGTGAKVLTVGASVGPLTSSNSLPLIMRGVGPGLKDLFGIADALTDPTMTVYRSGSDTPVATNDNWGSGDATALSAAFRSVGAFDLTQGSLDSAYASLSPGFGVGGYTVQVAGKGTASGTVIAEIYDASGTARTADTPRLVNLSTRAQIDTNGELRVGFVLRGLPTKPLSRTVLIRAVGPSLAALGVDGTMPDPKIELFDNDHGGAKLGENDNWGGDTQIATVSNGVGAFALSGPATKDAVLLVTLQPGAYSARLSGVGGNGGTAIVEVYEVP